MESEKMKIYLADVPYKCKVMVGDKMLSGVKAIHIDGIDASNHGLVQINLDMAACDVLFGDARELEKEEKAKEERPPMNMTITSAPLTNADWDLMGSCVTELEEAVADKKMDAPINIEINVTQTFRGELDAEALKKTSDAVEKAVTDALRRRGYLN